MPSFFRESWSLIMLFFVHSFPCVASTYFSSVQASYLPNSFTKSDSKFSSLSIPSSFIQFQALLKVTLATDSVALTSQSPQVQSQPFDFDHFSLQSSSNFASYHSPPHNSPPHILPAPQLAGHPMITRSKARICKLKSYISTLLSQRFEPTFVSQVLSHPMWFKATQ